MPPHLSDEKGFRTIPASTVEVVGAMSPDELRAHLLGLLEISKAFLIRQDLAALLNEYLKSLRTALQIDSASVLLFSPDHTSLEVKAADGVTPDAEGATVAIEPGEGVLGKVAAGQEAIIIDSVAAIEKPGPGFTGLASSMVAPLIVEGELIGFTRVGTEALRRFSDFDLLLLRASSEHLALAIRTWQLHEEADEQTSDRARIVQALADAESRQKVLAETAADAIISIDANSTIVTANPAATAIFGYSLEELVNRPFTDLIPERLREAHLAGIGRYVRTGQKRLSWRAMELPGLDRSGREIPFEVSFAEGVVQGKQLFTGTLRDISERKRAERVLAAQYATTRVLAESPTVQDAMPKILASLGPALDWDAGGFWTWDEEIGALTATHFWTSPSLDGADFTSVSENTVFQPGIGLPGRVWQARKPAWIPEIAVDRNFLRLHAANRLGLKSAFAFPICVSGDCLGVMEFFTTRTVGRDDQLLSTMDALGSDIGQFIRRREAEGRVESQEKIQRFFAKVGTTLSASALDYDATLRSLAQLAVPTLADWSSVHVRNPDGSIERAGIAHGDPSKAHLTAALEDYPVSASSDIPSVRAIETGKSVLVPSITDDSLKATAKDKRHLQILRDLEIRSAIVLPLIARDRTLGSIALVSSSRARPFTPRDVELAEEFARRGSVALDNARLYRESQEANRAKAEFLAIVSHELRTPLNAIIGYADLLGLGMVDGDTNRAKEYAGRIGVSARHLHQLIEEVLAFSRTESGREIVTPESVTLQQILTEIQVIADPLAAEKKLELSVNRSGPTVEMSTDAGKVRQILLNIVGNAIKFTSEGDVEVDWNLEDDRVLIEVRDTGIGIAEENMQKIFEPFWQVEQGTTRAVGGTGLGLTVSRRLAELLGGRLEIESELGSGTTVTVDLPLRSEKVTRVRGADRRQSGRVEGAVPGASK